MGPGPPYGQTGMPAIAVSVPVADAVTGHETNRTPGRAGHGIVQVKPQAAPAAPHNDHAGQSTAKALGEFLPVR